MRHYQISIPCLISTVFPDPVFQSPIALVGSTSDSSAIVQCVVTHSIHCKYRNHTNYPSHTNHTNTSNNFGPPNLPSQSLSFHPSCIRAIVVPVHVPSYCRILGNQGPLCSTVFGNSLVYGCTPTPPPSTRIHPSLLNAASSPTLE